ncbi:unnamed protein product [Phytophthora lilii]|nr:unnamed protein product [Phytophthora lilii]
MEHDADGFPIVDVLRSNHSTNQARRMTDSQLLKHLNEDAQAADKLKQQECGASSKRYRVKHVVLLGGSYFDPRTQKLSNYRALVGGDVMQLVCAGCSHGLEG